MAVAGDRRIVESNDQVVGIYLRAAAFVQQRARGAYDRAGAEGCSQVESQGMERVVRVKVLVSVPHLEAWRYVCGSSTSWRVRDLSTQREARSTGMYNALSAIMWPSAGPDEPTRSLGPPARAPCGRPAASPPVKGWAECADGAVRRTS